MKLIGLCFQVLGVTIIFGSHVRFWIKAKKEYGNIKRAFLDFAFPRYGTEDVRKLSEADVKEGYEKIPLARWLYGNYQKSFIGSLFTLVGVVINFIG